MAQNLIRLKQLNTSELSGFFAQTAINTGAFGNLFNPYLPNASNQIINTTYSTLSGLKSTNSLASGQSYRISDFVLKWNNQSINDPTVKTAASGEPLIVTALSENKLSDRALSETYPQDTIYYDINASGSYSWGDINNNAAIPGFKGWIYRRVDNFLGIDIPYDWRNIRVNCCKPDVSSVPNYSGNYSYNKLAYVRETGNNSSRGKLYYSVITGNSGNPLTNISYWNPVSDFVESGTYFATKEDYGFKALYYTDDGSCYINLPALTASRIQQPTFTSTLTGLGTFALDGVKNIKISNGHSNVIQGENAQDNLIGNGFEYNTIGINFQSNIIGAYFRNNIIAINFQFNKIDSFFQNNVLMNYFYSNNIAVNFYANTTSRYFDNNNIGNYFVANAIGDNFNSNSIDTYFMGNFIDSNFYKNSIRNTFGSNNIGSYFSHNFIWNGFSSNTVGNYFNGNITESAIDSVNLLSATHVYNSSYSKTLFKNSAASIRLRYFNSNDQLVVTDPTA
jgi:hypothetical protein